MPKKPAETGTISTFLSDENRHSLCWRHGDAHSFKAQFKVGSRLRASQLCSHNVYSMMKEAAGASLTPSHGLC